MYVDNERSSAHKSRFGITKIGMDSVRSEKSKNDKAHSSTLTDEARMCGLLNKINESVFPKIPTSTMTRMAHAINC